MTELDDRDDRTTIAVETVAAGRLRDFFGFNRAKHAVIEAAILATRTAFLPPEEIRAEFERLAVLVDKTGGPAEHAAFDHLRKLSRRGGPPRRLPMEVALDHDPAPHPDTQPASFRPPGMGPRVATPVRRGRPHDRCPGLEFTAEPSPSWHAEGPLAARTLDVARRVAGRLARRGHAPPRPVRDAPAPPEHAGLGVGTS